MKDLNLDELLRYFLIGVFTIFLLYISTEKSIIEAQLKILGTADVFGIFSFVGLMIGALQYVIYRAVIYPFLFNQLAVLFVKNKYKKAFPQINDRYIYYIDSIRWKLNNESVKKSLSEWASQVHFLYNITISCWVIWFFSTYYFSSKPAIPLLGYSLTMLFISVIHHVRYKLYELKTLINFSLEQE